MYQRPRFTPWLVILAALSSCAPQPTGTSPADTPPAAPAAPAATVAIMPGTLNADMQPAKFRTQASTNTLAGQLTDARTGAPIPGGVVTIYGSTLKATSDAWGYYYLENLPAGSRGAYFNGPGFTGKAVTVAITNTAVTKADVALNFATSGTGTITGRLHDAVSGAAIAGAAVYLNKQTGTETTSGADGTFRIPNAVAGAQQVVATPTGYKLWPDNVKNVILYANGTTTADISLQPDASATPAPSTAPTTSPTATPTTTPTSTPTATPTQAPTTPTGNYAPASGVYHGAFAGDLGTTSTATQVNSVVGAFENLAGKKLGVVNFFVGNGTFPTSAVTAIAARNSLPMVSLSPGGPTLDQIAAGSADTQYRSFAQGAKAYGKPVLVRWGWEMNGSGYSWAGSTNGANMESGPKYVRAWRHVVDVFRAQGASNVKFVWCIDAWGRGPADGAKGKWNYFGNYYPGDAYVDWAGADGYQWPGSNYNTFGAIFDDPNLSASFLTTMRNEHPTKPVLIGEMGVATNDSRAPQWIADAYSSVANKYTNVKALVWFNKNQDGSNWALVSGSAQTNAYRSAVSNSAYIDRFTPGTSAPTPTPTATANPTPAPTATAYPTPVPTATANPTPAPTATATPLPPQHRRHLEQVRGPGDRHVRRLVRQADQQERWRLHGDLLRRQQHGCQHGQQADGDQCHPGLGAKPLRPAVQHVPHLRGRRQQGRLPGHGRQRVPEAEAVPHGLVGPRIADGATTRQRLR